jgi:DNA-binding NarL/FixJ family response regulator
MSAAGRYRVVVVDDSSLVRSALISLLEAGDDIDVVGEAGNGRHAVEVVQQVRPDVVLLDIRMPLVDGVTAAKTLSETSRVVMLTHSDDPGVVMSAIRNGAAGYLVHGMFTDEELRAAVRETVRSRANPLSPAAATALVESARTPANDMSGHRARYDLSARETEVMDLISKGYANYEIAGRLFLTEKTVKNHINHIFAKLGVEHRTAAVARWLGTEPEHG